MCTIMEEYGMRRELRGEIKGDRKRAEKDTIATIRQMLIEGFTDYALIARIARCSVQRVEEAARKFQP